MRQGQELITFNETQSRAALNAALSQWRIAAATEARLKAERAGLKEGIIPVGAQVTIRGHRNLDPKRFEIKTERVTWNGRLFNVYPERD